MCNSDFQIDLESGNSLTQNLQSHSLAEECEELKISGKAIILQQKCYFALMRVGIITELSQVSAIL